jgi:hypothetical protein
MIRRGVVGPVAPAHAERDGALNLVRQEVEIGPGVLVQPPIGANRRVAARDVEPDAHHAHLIAIGGDAADRHHVPEMAVRHERHPLRAARHVAQLLEGLLVVGTENHRLTHASPSFPL